MALTWSLELRGGQGEDCDIETPECNPKPGVWKTDLECECGAELDITAKLSHELKVARTKS